MTVSLQKNADGSVVLPLTREILEALSLRESSSVELAVENGQLIVHANGTVPGLARRRPRYTMEELLADYDQIPKDPDQEFEWLNSPPVGRELI